jgi:DNA-binding CsgD family transcriptional regulator
MELEMEPFDVAQSFVERARALPPERLGAAFQITIAPLGFRYFACCSHVDPLHPPPGAVVIHNYPGDWVAEFAERRLYQIDPVLFHAEQTLLPFRWDAPEFLVRTTTPQREILAQAAIRGLIRGYTIPIHLPWTSSALRASCSVVPDSESIDSRSYFALHLMAMHLYGAACRTNEPLLVERPHKALSLRERQCLELVAQGKSDWAIGQILHISEHTVHRYIESAKRRLGVATRVQAIVCALQGRQISMGDVIRADKPIEIVRN